MCYLLPTDYFPLPVICWLLHWQTYATVSCHLPVVCYSSCHLMLHDDCCVLIIFCHLMLHAAWACYPVRLALLAVTWSSLLPDNWHTDTWWKYILILLNATLAIATCCLLTTADRLMPAQVCCLLHTATILCVIWCWMLADICCLLLPPANYCCDRLMPAQIRCLLHTATLLCVT